MKGARGIAVVFLLAAALALAVSIAGGWQSWSDLRAQAADYPWRLHVGLLAGALGCATLALLWTGRVWAVLFRKAGGKETGAGAVAAWLGSNLGRYLPGKVWQLSGLAAWLRARGDSGAAGFATSLALQAVMLVTGLAVGVVFAGGEAAGALGPVPAALLGTGLLAMLHPRVLGGMISLGARLLREREPSVRPEAGSLARAGLAALAIWALYGVGFRLLVHGLAPGVSLGQAAAVGIFAAAYVAGYVVLVAPGGLVVREGALAGLLIAATGIPPGAAAAVAAAARIWTTAAELVAFGIAAALAGARGRPDAARHAGSAERD
ncbi:MAG: hypothetical protein R3195_06195 [Gemmatimonadota bacterium]|nr:hypothetical protein [Gemmatimonadota bacterium]